MSTLHLPLVFSLYFLNSLEKAGLLKEGIPFAVSLSPDLLLQIFGEK
jgi:hypothetical protein